MGKDHDCGMGEQNDSATDTRPKTQLLSDGGDRRQNERQPRQDQQPQQGRQPRQGQQRQGRQPRQGQQRQGQQPRQGRQRQGRQPQQPPQGPPGGSPQGGQDDGGFTRRQLLVGGAGAAAVAGAGGWFFFLRGPGGAAAVADDYIDAVADNDWSGAEELFHEESTVAQTIEEDNAFDNFEQILENEGQLSQLENLSPSVKNHIEFSHYPEYDEQTAGEVEGFGLPGPDVASTVDEVKQISSIFEVDVATWYEENEAQRNNLAGDTTTESATFILVSADGEWSLWRRFGL